jgi:hypothetical protein
MKPGGAEHAWLNDQKGEGKGRGPFRHSLTAYKLGMRFKFVKALSGGFHSRINTILRVFACDRNGERYDPWLRSDPHGQLCREGKTMVMTKTERDIDFRHDPHVQRLRFRHRHRLLHVP